MTSNTTQDIADQNCEAFQPVPVTSPDAHPLLFRLRCLVDLQLATIVQYLRPALKHLEGKIIDVGAGESPWRAWLPPATQYQGIDVGHAGDFGMGPEQGSVIYYDGKIMPLADSTFDAAICIEVLEHAEDPELMLDEIGRILKPGGTLLLTVPWSARRHHIPHDYHRFTRDRLDTLLRVSGFTNIDIRERGNDIGAIANKLTVLVLRLLRPRKTWQILWSWPLGFFCGIVAVAFIFAAHISVFLGMGSRDDPLGYFVQAQKKNEAIATSLAS